MRLKLSIALVAMGLLASIAAPAAPAGNYVVAVCTAAGAGGEAVLERDAGSTGLEARRSCGSSGVAPVLGLAPVPNTDIRGRLSWLLNAPAEATIARLDAIRNTGTWPTPDLVWEVGNERGQLLDQVATTKPAAAVSYVVNSGTARISLRCAIPPCRIGGNPATVSLESIVATLEDNIAPRVQLLPMLEGPASGTVPIRFRASDEGAGVRTLVLFVDGQPVAALDDTNEGRCVAPFRFLAPCRQLVETSLALDTTKLSQGPHLVHVLAGDAAGMQTASANAVVTVDNTPPPVDPPKPPSPPAAPAAPDRGPVPAQRPALRGVSLSRKSVKVGGRMALRFSGSEAGTLSVAISPARGRSPRPLATLTRAVGAGVGSFPIGPRFRGKLLRPGPYRVSVSLRDADGQVSEPAGLRFNVQPR